MASAQKTKRVVTIGGGTGTFVVLSALRLLQEQTPIEITAIVSSADDGGSTGRLRDAYGMLPPGDARQALVALAEEDTVLRKLFAYRFSKGDVAGHNLGNLFLTALADLLGSSSEAIREASRILRIDGQVLSVSEEPSQLLARLTDGTELVGEHAIDERNGNRAAIVEVRLASPVHISSEAREAILGADLLVLGPGDLYTSTVAALLPTGVHEALSASSAKVLYVMNLFTKAGQTNGYTVSRHVEEVERYAGRKVDVVLCSATELPGDAVERYACEGESPVVMLGEGDVRVLRRDLASISFVEPVPEDPVPRSLVRHDAGKLAAALGELL